MAEKPSFTFKNTHKFVSDIFSQDLHAKRVYSLSNATLGILNTGSLAVCTIGHGLALARGLLDKHAVKQVDRLLSNAKIEMAKTFANWVPYVVGARTQIVVAMDWTDFDADDQTTLKLSLLSQHGRATPLVWLTVEKSTLKHKRNGYEYQALKQLKTCLPPQTEVIIVADRGFGDHKLYEFLTTELDFGYLIRFRGNIAVTSADGETRQAADWVGRGGRATTLRQAQVTASGYPVNTIVCVHAKDMKEPWCLASSNKTAKAQTLIATYGKRWGIETGFRDSKDLRFGMGMSSIRVSSPERRDRLWLLNALAVALLTLLGAAGEALGYDRHLKTNTTKRRTHSLLRQGALLYDLIPNMPEIRLRPLIEKFDLMINEQKTFTGIFGTL